LTFRQNFNLQASPTDSNVGFDGGVFELSIPAEIPFKILSPLAGASLAGYNRTIALIQAAPLLVVKRGAATRKDSS
jgi:hypothetical protein